MHHSDATPDPVPPPDPGLVHLERPTARGPALYRLVAAALREREGPVLWVDAGGDAGTLTLAEHLPRGGLDRVRVARAFTAYQHHELVRRAVGCAGDAAAVVVPCTAAIYRDEDVPEWFGEDLLAASLATLRELAGAADLPVLVTTPGESARWDDRVAAAADRTVRAEQTRAGLRLAGPDWETTAYRDREGWQTTIPYWVALFGCVCDRERPAAPARPALAEG